MMRRTKVKLSSSNSSLWQKWEELLGMNSRRVVLIEAVTGAKWTASALTEEALRLTALLSPLGLGTRVAFCLPNGAEWMAFFLAIQKCGLAAMPLDSSLSEDACLEMAQQLGCRALYFEGKLHLLDHARKVSRAVCCIKVTSGTGEGLPKTVSCRAEHLIADGSNIIRTMGILPADRNLVSIPLGHSYGLGNFVLPLILQGTSLVCAGHFVPRQLVDWIKLHRITVFPSVPALFRVLASMPGRCGLAPLRLAISAGAPLTADVASAFYKRYGIKIHNFYGSSETGGICYDRRGNATLKGLSVGKPLAGVDVSIAHGAIKVKSAAVAKRGGHWRTPDRGEWNAKGELVLLGRLGREVNLGGKKVHPSEVERALRGIPGVSDAIVWAHANSGRAFLQAAVETRLPLEEVQRALATKLPEWKFPKRYLILPEFPRTARGKMDISIVRREMQKQAR